MIANIGIDVGKEKIDVCWLRDKATGKKKTKVFKNGQKYFEAIAAWLVKNTGVEPSDILVTLEPTGIYHEALCYFLSDAGFNIFVANPGKARKHSDALSATHKTDKIDAYLLAEFGAAQKLPIKLWKPEAPEVRELRALLRRLSALEKDLQREENRLEASEISQASERVIASLKNMIDALKEEIKQLQKTIDDHIDNHPQMKRNRELLKSIKGIGDVMSREMVYLFASKQFNSAKQLAAYLGVIPMLKESGTLKGRTMMSKCGPARIRAKLYMAAIVASQHNLDIKAQKDRLLNSGKNKMQALGAAMRKLVQICFGVIKNQTEYSPQTV